MEEKKKEKRREVNEECFVFCFLWLDDDRRQGGGGQRLDFVVYIYLKQDTLENILHILYIEIR